MRKEKDRFQTLVIFGLPFYLWLGGVATVMVGRLLIRAPFWQFGFLAKVALLTISLMAGIIFSYLTYWFFVWFTKSEEK